MEKKRLEEELTSSKEELLKLNAQTSGVNVIKLFSFVTDDKA
jgi:ribosomal protein L29